jgi:SH3-like domain-containing protein
MRRGNAAALSAAFALLSFGVAAADAPATGPDSNLPVPRYVSLGAEGANGRQGPGLNHRVEWIYQRAGLPLQVTAENGPWRRVRDPDGAEVWMHAQNLATRRSVYVRDAVALRREAAPTARVAAYLEPGVIGALTGCDGDWRRVSVAGRVGWLEATHVWGADDCADL